MTGALQYDTLNPTGYAQVLDEVQSGAVTRTYAWGLQLVSETQLVAATPPASPWQTSWYGYDGHGSVRYLTDASGAVTDTYTYDAFGNLINSTGSTANNYLFAGEQYDPDLGLYYNRARYLDVRVGRFWGMDDDEGDDEEPLSLHKYMYVYDDPVILTDSNGNEIDEIMGSFQVSNTINAQTSLNYTSTSAAATPPVLFQSLWNAYSVSTPCHDITNQCAIRVANALYVSGVSFKSYPGGKTPPCGITGAQELANWLAGATRFKGQGKTQKFTGSNWRASVGGKTGIIFFQHYWHRDTDPKGVTTGDHIDLWNKWILTTRDWASQHAWEALARGIGISTIPGLWSDLSKSKSVWFWEVQ
jgi:RHS repeat-associated protein